MPEANDPQSLTVLDDAGPSGSLGLAIVGGGVAALIGAAVWGGIAKGTGYEIGWIALGIGFLCGVAVRALGKGSTPPFRAVGAATALSGVVLGKIFTILWVVSDTGESISFADAVGFLPQTFGAMDLLFAGIAIWEGWKFSAPPEG